MGAYCYRCADPGQRLAYLAAQPPLASGIQELLATSFTLDKPLVLQTTGLHVDPTVPYRPEFWDSYQVLVPATVQEE